MPWGDGTGPMGMGPMTGSGAGYCAGFNKPGTDNPCFGRGARRGRACGPGRRGPGSRAGYPGAVYRGAGFGYGFRPAPWQEISPEQERQELEMQASYLRETLDNLEKRISGLQQEQQEKEA